MAVSNSATSVAKTGNPLSQPNTLSLDVIRRHLDDIDLLSTYVHGATHNTPPHATPTHAWPHGTPAGEAPEHAAPSSAHHEHMFISPTFDLQQIFKSVIQAGLIPMP